MTPAEIELRETVRSLSAAGVGIRRITFAVRAGWHTVKGIRDELGGVICGVRAFGQRPMIGYAICGGSGFPPRKLAIGLAYHGVQSSAGHIASP